MKVALSNRHFDACVFYSVTKYAKPTHTQKLYLNGNLH